MAIQARMKLLGLVCYFKGHVWMKVGAYTKCCARCGQEAQVQHAA